MRRMETIPERQSRVAARLARLSVDPPASLLLEGGTEAEREAMAIYWAQAVNCEAGGAVGSSAGGKGPCGACTACVQLAQRAHRDLFFFDFRAGPWADCMDELKAARRVMGEPPREGGRRVIVLFEAHGMLDPHANLLLKSIEEPGPYNVFVITTPQRERILPTLVSRSFTATLAWPPPGTELAADLGEGDAGDVAGLARAFYGFLASGKGLFAMTGGRGKVGKAVAERLVLLVQRDLAQALAGAPAEEGARLLAARLDREGLRRLDLALDQAKQSLDTKVNPSLVVDWLAVTARGWLG
ncbi:DNA polymerase III subunit delta [Desulfovibrio sp. X2]|uniref:DNA polymerase III subunit delta n=1 Tax=Desulfovibrio sp. X2 TaxID=941449 RepID=UPI000358D4D2|nr:DNA polymerase III subunit delta [Desulfovibrio sp. X2]EPR41255.1 DNA polymerase III subunit delta [Desulfovibrio sp. X2]